jgi:hypothetical protein
MDKTKITKEEFFNLDTDTKIRIAQEFIYPHILRNQSALITKMQELEIDGFLYWEDVENLFLTDEEILENFDDSKEDEEITQEEFIRDYRYNGYDEKEVMEWYLVSDWLLDKLKLKNQVFIDNDYGEYWGRCCTNQSIYLDFVIQELAYEYSYDERLYKNVEVA